jgi:hypothetical protein
MPIVIVVAVAVTSCVAAVAAYRLWSRQSDQLFRLLDKVNDREGSQGVVNILKAWIWPSRQPSGSGLPSRLLRSARPAILTRSDEGTAS